MMCLFILQRLTGRVGAGAEVEVEVELLTRMLSDKIRGYMDTWIRTSP